MIDTVCPIDATMTPRAEGPKHIKPIDYICIRLGVMHHQVETSSHWGTYLVDVDDEGRVVGTRPHADDPDAAPAIANVADAQQARSRVAQPAVRRRWLDNGPGPDDHRGDPDDEYVEVE